MFKIKKSKITNEKIIVFSALIYIIIFALFYPKFYGSSDEQEYLHGAYLLRAGSLFATEPYQSYEFPFNGEKYVYTNFIGQSVLLLPFTFLGWESAFLSGLLVHLFGTFIFYKILKKLNIDTKNTLLYLFFPPFLYLSRTLFNNLATAVILLTGFYFYISDNRKHHIVSGFLFGLACVFRYTAIIGFLSFALVLFFNNRKKLLNFIIGFSPIAVFVLMYNNFIFGGPFNTVHYLIPECFSELGFHVFSISYAPQHLLEYSAALLILYPLMLLAPFAYKGKYKYEILSIILFGIGFYSLFWYSGFEGRIFDFILGTRYLTFIFPFFLISYATVNRKFIRRLKLPYNRSFWILIFGLFLNLILMFSMHQDFVSGRYEVFRQIYENTNDNSLIIGTLDDFTYFLPKGYPPRNYLNAGDDSCVYGGSERLENILTENIGNSKHNSTYIIRVRYSNQKYRTERDFARALAQNYDAELIYNMTAPHYLEIYEVNKSFKTIK